VLGSRQCGCSRGPRAPPHALHLLRPARRLPCLAQLAGGPTRTVLTRLLTRLRPPPGRQLLELEVRQKESADKAAQLAQEALEAERKLVGAMRGEAAANAELMQVRGAGAGAGGQVFEGWGGGSAAPAELADAGCAPIGVNDWSIDLHLMPCFPSLLLLVSFCCPHPHPPPPPLHKHDGTRVRWGGMMQPGGACAALTAPAPAPDPLASPAAAGGEGRQVCRRGRGQGDPEAAGRDQPGAACTCLPCINCSLVDDQCSGA
jgi:hypothetical protein